jgi:ABC-type transport system substrate-binding protein
MYEIAKLKLDWSREISFIEPRSHILGFNLHHPVFGTGVATPNGVANPGNASLYAKYVRQALNYLIPRQEIIDQLWEGYAVLGVEAIPPVLNAFNSELVGYTYQPLMARLLLQMAGYVIPLEPIVIPIEVFLILGVIVIVGEVIFVAFLLIKRHQRVRKKFS